MILLENTQVYMLLNCFMEYIKRLFGIQKASPYREYSASEHIIRIKEIPLYVVKIIERLESSGYEAYLVGGCLRDIMAGLKPKDFDVATNARPADVLKVFPRSIAIGRRFRIVHVRMGREVVEIITFRGSPSGSWLQRNLSKRALENSYGTKETDTNRRDFTINAFLYKLDGTLIDFHEGIDDFNNKLVRCIGNPAVRFKEDPVRMLRALRLQAKLGFVLDPPIVDVICKQKKLLSEVSSQRMFQEVIKLCYQGHGEASWSIIREYGLVSELLPWEKALDGSMKKDLHTLVSYALVQSDDRFKQGSTLSVAFLLAVLNWVYFRNISKAGRDNKGNTGKRFARSFSIFSETAFKRLQPSRRIIEVVRQIYAMQNALVKEDYRSIKYCIRQSRLRAAVDFLYLRSKVNTDLQLKAKWWLEFINSDPTLQEEMILQKKPKELL
jgi:poly(A) polymerase